MSNSNIKKGGPTLPDLDTLYRAGIDPKTRLPLKVVNSIGKKPDVNIFCRLIDEQDAVNRYKWYNLPTSISGQDLERFLYYKGQLAFFYMEETDEFYFMPYALDGGIDFYGRYTGIHPVPYAEGSEKDPKSEKIRLAQLKAMLSMVKRKVIYDVVIDDVTTDMLNKSAVLLHDYTKQIGENIIPRQMVNDSLVCAIADCVPLLRTALIAGCGVRGIKVQSADEQQNVSYASKSVEESALNGQIYLPIIGEVGEFQELADKSLLKAEEFTLSMQSLDNFRLSGYGLDNGGLFEKKQHILESENEINQIKGKSPLIDGLEIRQRFCNIVNSIWKIGIWCELGYTANTEQSEDMGQSDMAEGDDRDDDTSVRN